MILDNEDILIQAATDSVCYKMVDLGLSVKWANKNVGAYSPEDAGLYFQWGDTVGYTADQLGKDKVFDWDSYFDITDCGSMFKKYNNNGGLTVLESIDDAATVNMGSNYRMPTYDEIRELIDNTTQTFIDVDGNEYSKEQAQNRTIESRKLKGVRFTSSNGNSIFIPAAGYCNVSLLCEVGMYGGIWSSILSNGYDDYAKYLFLYYRGSIHDSNNNRRCGLSVRGVS